jgi:ATP-binding cassette subfamily F protein uup
VKAPAPAKPAAAERQAARAVKLSFNEKRELAALPDKIAKLEAEQTGLQQLLASPDIYRTRGGDIPAMNARLAEIDEELMQLLERWESLESKNSGA